MRNRLIILGILAAAILTGLFVVFRGNDKIANFQATGESTSTAIVEIGDKKFSAELAVTPDQQSTGLSYRELLNPGTGMLFIFDQPNRPSFWMREMRFNLDIIWISEDLKVVGIEKNVPAPNLSTPPDNLPRYVSPEDILYVLELNAGEGADITVGSQVVIRYINSQ